MSGSTSTVASSIQERPPAEKWLFSEDELFNTPSRRENVPAEKELNYRQQAANLIQDMGQRLPVNQLTINTAIVYMHRFYMFHSFQAFSRFVMAPTALFLAAKVEEQPKKLEHVIRVCHGCLHPDKPHLDVHSDSYLKQAQQLVEHELIMLQTLGFDISIDHPHTHVVKCTQLVKASRDLSQMAYFMATNSLHLTTFCLKYKPTVVSAMCIHLSCKWSNYEIPLSHEGKAYWTYMDPTITEALLENIIKEFLKILNLCPTRLRKLKNYRPSSKDGSGGSTPHSKDGQQPRSSGNKMHPSSRSHQSPAESRRPGQHHSAGVATSDSKKMPPPSSVEPQKKPPASITIAEYKNKREKELQQAKPNPVSSNPLMKPQAPGNSGLKQPSSRLNHPPTTAPPHGHLIKAEPHASKHPPKVPPNHHKRPDKQQHPHSLKPTPSGALSGPQRHKHPPPPHGASTHQHKEHLKMQSKEQHLHRMPHPTHHQKHPQQRPREHIVPKTEPVSTEPTRTQDPPPNASKTDDIVLAGMEQQVMEQMKAFKAKESLVKTEQGLSKTPPFEKPATSHPPKDLKSRHSLPNAPTTGHPQAPPVGKTYKILYEQYKKNPEALRQQLKHKAQSEPLTEEEKQIWHKLKKKEEDKLLKRKRKHEKQKLHRSQPVEGAAEKGKSTPGGGPLTVRIKLPPSAREEMSKSQASGSGGLHIGSSSGSGSEATLSSPGATVAKSGRKRTHAHDGGVADPISAKHSRKSEGHHHQSHQHHSSHDSSRHRHRHSRSGSHHHSKQHPPGHKIDDSTFQQALNDAVSMVQSGQAAPGTSGTDKPVPTVTLKRTGVQNGSGDYVAHASRHDKSKATKRSKQMGFDPSAPVSATPPEDLFDADAGEHSKPENYDGLATRNAELSSPEMGEVRDDDSDASPLREHVLQQSNYTQHQGTSYNNSGHRNQQWPSSSGAIQQQHSSNQRPPNLAHGNNMHGKHDARKSYDNRMPAMPSLTSKPNRAEQR